MANWPRLSSRVVALLQAASCLSDFK